MHTARVNVIKISRGIGPEAGDVVVAVGGTFDEVAEVFVKIRLAIAVLVPQTRDLITAEHVNLVVGDLEAERLVKAGGEALPEKSLQSAVDARHAPDIAMNRADIRRTVGGKVNSGEEHQAPPR